MSGLSSLTLTPEQMLVARPLPGRVILRIDSNPDRVGSIHIPESARGKQPEQTLQTATVIAVGYNPFYRREEGKLKRYSGVQSLTELRSGDRVIFRPVLSELNQQYVLTDVRRVDAVLESEEDQPDYSYGT